jgi:predicted kinase
VLVIVSGAPGAGKSTLARPLAAALGIAIIEKDVIKETLADVLGFETLVDSQLLGRAATEVLFALIAASDNAIVESAWIPELARPRLEARAPRIVEVFCDAPPEVAFERYRARVGTRHAVHFDAEQSASIDGWAERSNQVADGGWPVIRVNTTRPVDIHALADEIKRLR